MYDKIKVMLTTEGTYPYHQGGVSTWCNLLVHNLSQVDYVIYSIIMNPFVSQKFPLPDGSVLIKVPLWGTEEPSEHLATPFSQVYIAKRNTVDKIIKDHFLSLFIAFIEEIISPEKDAKRLGLILVEMYKYFQEYDYRKSFKSELIWNVFKKMILSYTGDPRNKMEEPNVFSLSINPSYAKANLGFLPLKDIKVSKLKQDKEAYHFLVASFFRFMAANLSLTQFVTWVRPR